MAEVNFQLLDGLKQGEDLLRDVVLREPTAGDIIDSQAEAERLVMVPGKDGLTPSLVASPSMVGIHLLRRQVVRIGNLSGPLSLDKINRLTERDFELLQEQADTLEHAASVATARELDARGRHNQGQGRGSSPGPDSGD